MTSLPFHHKPLNHTIKSLRLVHLNPELSSDGHIQCTISHTTTMADYVCLSYRWGEEDVSQQNQILIDGKSFLVRQNLFDFLSYMRVNAPQEDAIFNLTMGYWIDALCIDQHNISERNHQVAQMGSIFSRAEYVHVWLGTIADRSTIRPLLTSAPWSSLVGPDMRFIDEHILRNKYWTRAWIVQEIRLARRVELSLGAERCQLPDLILRLRYYYPKWTGTPFEQFVLDEEDIAQIRGQPLITSLSRFSEKECSLIHDRVFSLLPLVEEIKGLSLDYNMERSELAYRILSIHGREISVCSALVVARCLDLQADIEPYVTGNRQVFLNFDIENFELQRVESSCNACFVLKHSGGDDSVDHVRQYGLFAYGCTKKSIAQVQKVIRHNPRLRDYVYGDCTYGCTIRWLSHLSVVLFENSDFRDHMSKITTIGQNVSLSEALSTFGRSELDNIHGCEHVTLQLRIRVLDRDKNICSISEPLSTLRQIYHKSRLCVACALGQWRTDSTLIKRLHVEYR
jgi:hypothetical protein